MLCVFENVSGISSASEKGTMLSVSWRKLIHGFESANAMKDQTLDLLRNSLLMIIAKMHAVSRRCKHEG